MNAINKLIVKFVKMLPKSIVYIFAKKYIAGVKLEDAVSVVKELNEKGILATMDVLGESIATKRKLKTLRKNACLFLMPYIKTALMQTFRLNLHSLASV